MAELPEITCVAPRVEGKNGHAGNGIIYNPIDVHITKAKNREIKYLVIHYTAGRKSTEGSAEAERKVFINQNASADFIVDDQIMLQVNPDPHNYYCWAVGDGKGKYGITNKDCVSIEICSTLAKDTTYKMPNHEGWSFSEDSLNNAVELAKILMSIYHIPIENVIRHYDVSHKACPGLLGWNPGNLYDKKTGKQIKGQNTEEKWEEFKARLVEVPEEEE